MDKQLRRNFRPIQKNPKHKVKKPISHLTDAEIMALTMTEILSLDAKQKKALAKRALTLVQVTE